MKFTIDTEEKVIYFNEPFTKNDIEFLFDVIKIEGIESWKIDYSVTVNSKPYSIGSYSQVISETVSFNNGYIATSTKSSLDNSNYLLTEN